MTSKSRLLVLIDVDGTLLAPGLTPRHCISEAIGRITGKQVKFEIPQLAGLTDPLILENTLKMLGIPQNRFDGQISDILNLYVELLRKRYPASTDKMVYPGVRPFLDYLNQQPVRLGLITGNVAPGARIKLAPFDLSSYFSLGVFGSDHHDRDRLPLIALQRVTAQFGESFLPSQVVIVGDTVRDVWCAHRNRMRSVAVIRREERRRAIETEHPDLIVKSFEDLRPLRLYFEKILTPSKK